MDNKRIKIVYMSFSGNVRSFTHRLQEYATQQHHLNNENPLIDLLGDFRGDTSDRKR